MNLRPYLRVVKAHWVLILAAVVLCTGAAAAYAWTREDVYAAHTQMLVSTKTTTGLSPSQVYQGGLAAESRAEAYARVISSPQLAESAIEDLDLSKSKEEVQSAITASVVPGTSLIDVAVEDESAQIATGIADSLTVHFPEFVGTLESESPEASPVQVSVTSPPEVPTSPESPSKGLYLAGGAVIGLILGIAAAVLRELLDRRVRDDEAAEAIAGAPVLSHIPHDSGAKKRPLVVVEKTGSPESEAYRRLRTNLRVVTIDRDRRSVL